MFELILEPALAPFNPTLVEEALADDEDVEETWVEVVDDVVI